MDQSELNQSIEDAKINTELNIMSIIEFLATDAIKANIENNVKMDVIIVNLPHRGLIQEQLTLFFD